MSSSKVSVLIQTNFFLALCTALSACTLQAKISSLDSASGASSGTVVYNLSGHSDFGTTSITTYTSTKQSITITPSITGQISTYSVSPALPAGLTLNSSTGVISGRPTTPTLSASYVVTGTAQDGSSSTQTLTFEVAGYYLVNTTTDASDASAGNNICATAAGQCSLRAAAEEAAAQTSGTLALIDVPAGTFTLSGSGITLSTRTVLTGNGSTTTIISGGNSISPVITTTGTNVTLDKIEVSNGRNNTASVANGVGVYSTSDVLTMTNCRVANNTVNGAAIMVIGVGVSWSGSGTFTMDSCTVTGNSSAPTSSPTTMGVGIYSGSTNGEFILKNSTITSNSGTPTGGAVRGAGIHVANKLTMTNNTVSSNTINTPGAGRGAGIFLNGQYEMTISNLTCASNTIAGASGQGGCLQADSVNTGPLTVKNATISANQSSFGSGIYMFGSLFTIEDSTFTGNTGTGHLLYTNMSGASAGTSTIRNSTFYSTAVYAVYLNSSGLGTNYLVEHSTIHQTSAGTAALRISVSAPDEFKLKGSIVSVSGGSSACQIVGGGTLTTQGYNVARDATCTFLGGSDVQSSATIGLGALASNGGSTQTMAIGTGSSAYNLVPSGSCTLTTDQRGSARPNAGACDAGAYEY